MDQNRENMLINEIQMTKNNAFDIIAGLTRDKTAAQAEANQWKGELEKIFKATGITEMTVEALHKEVARLVSKVPAKGIKGAGK